MRRQSLRSTAFLVELLVNILVLCLVCAVLAGVFVQARLTLDDTNRRGAAGNEVYALLQTLKAGGEAALEAETAPDGSLVRGYDTAWQPVPAGQAAYLVTIRVQPEATGAGTLYRYEAVAADRSGVELCRIDTAVYRPEGGAAP